MILIEGIDRCGKTTLAKALRQFMPRWSYLGNTRPGMDPYTYFGRFLAYSRPEVIVDRMHLSDVAYQRVLRPGTEVLTDHQFKLMELMMMAQGTILTYVDDEPQDILDRWGPDEMYNPGLDQLTELRRVFLELLEGSKLHKIKINDIMQYANLVTGGLESHGVKLARRAKDLQRYGYGELPSPSVGIGSRHGFMLIGESVNDAYAVKDYTAQAPFSKGPASNFLWECLDLAEVPWWRGYYTNANEFHNWEDLSSLIDVIRPRVVMGLGKYAETLVKSCEAYHRKSPNQFDRDNYAIKYAYAKHPQAAKRFGGPLDQARESYAQVLKLGIDYNEITMGEDLTWRIAMDLTV